ncbi:hypothetical protein J550_2533 [Acinetobacter sp. 230853]|nr:hypothetical protein J550_2533 [Acinetobacter sp. 230853]
MNIQFKHVFNLYNYLLCHTVSTYYHNLNLKFININYLYKYRPAIFDQNLT